MKTRNVLRTLLTALAAGLCVTVAASIPGCSGCSGKAPLNYVPQEALIVVVVPSVSQALRESKNLLDKFRDNEVVKKGLELSKDPMVKELGFDPEKPETLKAKGIDPESGLVASVDADSNGSIVFGVDDAKTLEKFLREMAVKALGGGATFQEKDFGGVKATLLLRQGSEAPLIAWAYVPKYVIICPKAKDGKVGEHVASLTKLANTIKGNKTFAALRDKIGKHQVMVYVDGEATRKREAVRSEEQLKNASEWMKKYIKERKESTDNFLAYFRGGAFALHVTAAGMTVRGYFAVPADKGKAVHEIFKGTGDAPAFGKYFGPDALSVSRFSLDGKKLMDRVLETVHPNEKRSFYGMMESVERDTKLSVEKDIMTLLGGRYAAAVFAPSADAIKAGPPTSAAAWIRLLPAAGLAQVTDAKKAAELLVKLERYMVMARVEVRTKTDGDRKTYSLEDDGKTLVSWTVAKDMLIVATADRLEKTLALVNKGGDNVLGQVDSSRAKSLLKKDDGMVFYYNISKTADLIRAMEMPAEIKTMLNTGLGIMYKFSDVTLDFEVEDEGILGELSVRVK
jgi:hypothetical protein